MKTMKHLVLLAAAAVLIGCTQTAKDSVTSSETDSSETDSSETDSAATSDPTAAAVDSAPIATSYAAGDSVNLEVPEMHCPFGCFPKVKDALEEIDGIAGIELVKQEEEGAINDRRVVVTFDGAVDSQAAIAALDAVDMTGASFEKKETSDN
jgi:copper chaperone CopZ